MGQISCCVLDLETSNLNADFGIVLCGVVKSANDEPKIFRGDKLNPKWRTQRSNDSQTVKHIVEYLDQFDIWIAHNGAKFDIPYLRTRLAKWRLPTLPTKKVLDPVLLARNKLRMSYNSLEQIANFLGFNEKTSVNGEVWVKASLDGDRESMDFIVDHCIRDVLTLEKVVDAIKGYSTQLNSWGSGF